MLDGRMDVAFDAGRTPLLEHAWSADYAARLLQALEPFESAVFRGADLFRGPGRLSRHSRGDERAGGDGRAIYERG